MRPTMTTMWSGIFAVCLSVSLAVHASAATVGSVCNVLEFGAVGDGKTLDTAALNGVLQNRSCAEVLLPMGYVFLSGTLRLRSHLIVRVEGKLMGAPVGNYEAPEPNPWSQYQDFGHSHWHNSLMYAAGTDLQGGTSYECEDIHFEGGGVVDGGVGLFTGIPPKGGGNKMFAFQTCRGISIRNLTLFRTGHFALLATNVAGLHVADLDVHASRDGFDIVGCVDTLVERVRIAGGGDDALVLKSDYSLGKILPCTNVTVRHSSISTNGATALEIGSETVGPFSAIRWHDIVVESAGDAGIGMAIMDGSSVRDVLYENITMTGVTSPFQFYLGARCRQPNTQCQGSIRDVLVRNVTGSHLFDAYQQRNWTSSIDGQPVDPQHGVSRVYPIGPNITFTDIKLQYRGGGLKQDVSIVPHHNATDGWFLSLGVRPSWSFFIRHAMGIHFDGVTMQWDRPDQRPSVILSDAQNISWAHLQTLRGSELSYDIGVKAGCANIDVTQSPGVVVRKLS